MKKIEANDSRQSVDLKWKKRKALESLINFDGNKAEIGGDLEVDGVLSANSLPAGFGSDFAFAKLPIHLSDDGEDVDLGIKLPVLLFHSDDSAPFPGEEMTTTANYMLALACGKLGFEASGGALSTEFPTRCVPVYSAINVPANTMDEALHGFITAESLTEYPSVRYDLDSQQLSTIDDNIDNLSVYSLKAEILTGKLSSGEISGYIKLDGKTTLTENFAEKSSAKYQHTVTLRTPTSATDLFCFTAMSSKATPIDSYQDLTAVFGGCTVAGYGLDETSKLAFTKLNLHGGTIATDSLTDGEESRTLASFQTVTFADDVCVPK